MQAPDLLTRLCLYRQRLEVKELLCVVVADVFYHLVDTLHFFNGDFSVFNIVAQEVTQCTTEVFMTRIGEEGT